MNMKLFGRHLIVGLVIGLTITASTMAQESGDLGLEEMLNQVVVTPTRAGKRISETPAIISAFTGRELEELGVGNLYEALSFMPGIEIMETYYGYTAVQFRGILQQHYNNKAVLLLNGQPLYDQIVSCFYLEQIPLSSIDRIEVIRGPSGVLYGTNAYAGVINIITKKGATSSGGSAGYKGGSFATQNFRFSLGRQEKDLDMFIAGEYLDSKGYDKFVKYDEDDTTLGASYYGHSGDKRQLGYYTDDPDAYENDYVNLFGSFGYGGLVANGVYFKNNKDKFGIIPTLASTGERVLQGFGLNLGYTKAGLFQDRSQAKTIVWYDQIDKDERVNLYNPVLHAPGGRVDNQEYGGHKFGAQAELSYDFTNRIGLLGGLGYEQAYSSPYYFYYADSVTGDGNRIQDLPANAYTVEHTTADFWTFLQTEVSPLTALNLVAGGRYNNNQQAGGAVSSNLGAVYSFSDGFSTKLLFGTGFRNPSFFEKYVRTVNILAGVNDLKPERIMTIDLGADYRFLTNYSLRLNGFYNRTKDLISRRNLTAADTAVLNHEPGFGIAPMLWTKGAIYENKGDLKYQGIELELRGLPYPKLSFFSNLSYKQGKDSDGKDLLFFAPVLANGSFTFKPWTFLSITPSGQYVGSRKGHYKAVYPWNQWSEADYTLPSYSLANLSISVKPVPSLTVSFQANNLLDRNYDYPEYVRAGIPSIPGGPGRAFYLRLNYSF